MHSKGFFTNFTTQNLKQIFIMKKLKLIVCVAVLAVSFSNCKNKAESDQTLAEKTDNNTSLIAKAETASFSISGMSCAVMCANKIEKELTATKGVQKAKVDFDKKSAFITFDSNVITAQQLVAKVEAVADGKTYKVTNLKTSTDKAMLYGNPEKEKKAADRKAARAAKKAAKNPVVENKAKAGCCSGAKICAKTEKSGTL